MTDEQVNNIRARWVRFVNHSSAAPNDSQAAVDVQQLVAEVERLQLACFEITRQYARMCERCANKQHGYCELDDGDTGLSVPVVAASIRGKLAVSRDH